MRKVIVICNFTKIYDVNYINWYKMKIMTKIIIKIFWMTTRNNNFLTSITSDLTILIYFGEQTIYIKWLREKRLPPYIVINYTSIEYFGPAVYKEAHLITCARHGNKFEWACDSACSSCASEDFHIRRSSHSFCAPMLRPPHWASVAPFYIYFPMQICVAHSHSEMYIKRDLYFVPRRGGARPFLADINLAITCARKRRVLALGQCASPVCVY